MLNEDQRPFAVVTGGSSGIGFELSKRLVHNGYDVLIAADNEMKLIEAARQLEQLGGKIQIHSSDLSTEDGVNELYEAIEGAHRSVDVCCINAGVGLGGIFAETDLQRELRMIDINVRGAVQLTKLILRKMVAINSGNILITSSISATMPDPFEAVYGSTKVFLRWFGEALRDELKETEVNVTVLMPGPTDTNFFRRAEMMDTKVGTMKKDNPSDVAKAALDALWSGKDKVLPTVKNKVIGTVADILPDTTAAAAHRSFSKPGSAS